MTVDQLLGRLARLERELANAFGAVPWPGARIERLVEELAATEAEIAQCRPIDASRDDAASPESRLRSRSAGASSGSAPA